MNKRILFYSILLIFSLFPVYLLTTAKVSASNSTSTQNELANAVNALRIAHGLVPYSINSTLMSIAQSHSDYQASIGIMTHYGTGGSRPFQRALAAGYPVAGDLSLGGYFSENIAAGNFSIPDVISLWQGDAPHLNTMLSTTLMDIGAGISVSGNTIYYTIDVGLSTSSSSTDQNGATPRNYPTYPPFVSIRTVTPGGDGSITHVVQAGETLWTIASVYHLSVEDLMNLNHLSSDIIYVGQKILIKLASSPTGIILTATIPTETAILAIPSPTPLFSPTDQPVISKPLYRSDQKYVVLSVMVSGFFFLGIFSIIKLKIKP